MKFLCKFSVVILILGGILFGIGNAMGGTVYSAWYDGRLHSWHEARNIGFFGFPDRYTVDSFRHTIQEETFDLIHDAQSELLNTVHDIPTPSVPDMEDIENTQNTASAFYSNDVKNLEFNLGCGKYTIQRGTEFSVSGTGLEQIKSWADADTWHVSYSSPYQKDDAAAQRAVTITIPEDMTFHDIELNAGVSSVTLCALTADEINFTVGAGKLSTAPLTTNSLSAEVGVGSATIQLADPWESYHYEIESGLGTITVNGAPLANKFAGKSSGGQGARALDFTVGMGTIQITSKQN